MKKPMMVAVVSAGALIGILYNLPKVIVNDKKGLGIEAAKSASDTVSHLSTDHTVSLSPTQLADVNRLRNNFLTEANKEKKLKFADSLAVMFTQVSKPDSAASYWEEIARQEPTLANLLKAGNGYYDAFGFTVDTERANQYGEKARNYYLKVLDKNPEVLEAKSKMAMTYITTANPMQGIMLLREVITADPKNELALFNLGLLSIRSNQYDKAIERFRQVIQINPEHMQAQYYLGVCYIETGKKAEARKVFQLVKEKESDPAVQASVAEYLEKLN
jgi:tetratricopeptide (TPR) repeat protein